MNFSIAEIMRRLSVRENRLSCSWLLWQRLLRGLRERGRSYSRESGAFLLGYRGERARRISEFILYDDLDPNCLDSGIIRFDGRYFGKLWDICRDHRLTVVADVHTHPTGSDQSESDRANPMITEAGHIALIVPRFAKPPVRRVEVGVFRYDGAKRWFEVSVEKRMTFFRVGI